MEVRLTKKSVSSLSLQTTTNGMSIPCSRRVFQIQPATMYSLNKCIGLNATGHVRGTRGGGAGGWQITPTLPSDLKENDFKFFRERYAAHRFSLILSTEFQTVDIAYIRNRGIFLS
jgi:hypothetical protein